MVERDAYRLEGGNLDKDLEEKEAQAEVFDSGAPDSVTGHPDGTPVEGTFGDSRPDQTEPTRMIPADDSDDPNAHLTRRTSELTEPPREGAEALSQTHHNDVVVEGRPMGPLDEEGAVLRKLSEKQIEEDLRS
jgi:hypothetical protein